MHGRGDAVRRVDDRRARAAPRSPRRRRSRPVPRGRGRRGCCGRSACGRRRARRSARAPSRRSRPRARPRRSSRGATRGERVRPCRQGIASAAAAAQRDVSASRIPTSTTTPPDDLHRDERLPEPHPRDHRRGDGLERRDDPDRRRRQVLAAPRSRARTARSCRARCPRARARRPAPCRGRAAARPDCAARRSGSSTTGSDDRPGERGEAEPEADDRDRVAPADEPLAHEVVDRERDGREQARPTTPIAVEREPVPDLRHEREAAEHEREGGPDAPAHRLVPGEPCPQRDQHRRRELEEQPDPDRQPVDRDEVEPLHEREADDAVEREPAELAARPDPEPPRGERARARARGRRSRRSTAARSSAASRCRSPSSASFETAPLTANSVAAAIVIA